MTHTGKRESEGPRAVGCQMPSGAAYLDMLDLHYRLHNTCQRSFRQMPELPETLDLSGLSEPDPFLLKLERVKKLYSDMGAALGIEEDIVDHRREKGEAKGPLAYKEWKHLIYDGEEEDLDACQVFRAQFVLVFLATALRELLTDAKAEPERKAAPPTAAQEPWTGKPNKSRGTNWTRKDFQPFFSKFHIDIAKYSGWENVEEVVIARDAVLHPESMRNYRKSRVATAYVNGDEICLSARELNSTIKRLEDFCEWLRAEVEARR